MHLIKLSATDSTNAFLKNLLADKTLKDFTVVTANNQTNGRGQLGTTWLTEAGKNLTFSVLVNSHRLHASSQFLLNIGVSLAIYETLHQLQVPDLRIKWPNDIMAGHAKICGILIENMLSGYKIENSIIGIGLNVNQLTFNNLPNVSSLKLLMGKNFHLDELLFVIVGHLKVLLNNSRLSEPDALFKQYEERLFRKDKPSTFTDQTNKFFMGFIKGVSRDGKLQVLMEDNILKEFSLKEIKLLY